jgi:hypothetical protein
MIFTPNHIQMIQDGIKVETRRRLKEGITFLAKMWGEKFTPVSPQLILLTPPEQVEIVSVCSKSGRVIYTVGHEYTLQPGRGMVGKGAIRLVSIHLQRLRAMTDADAQAEGGYTLDEYRQVWAQINGAWDGNEAVIVYRFQRLPIGKE